MIDIKIDVSQELRDFIHNGTNKVKKQSQDALNEIGLHGQSKGREYLTPSVQTNRLRSSWHFEYSQTSSFLYRDREGKTYNGKFDVTLVPQLVVVGTNVNYAEDANKGSRSAGYVERTESYIESIIDSTIKKYIDV